MASGIGAPRYPTLRVKLTGRWLTKRCSLSYLYKQKRGRQVAQQHAEVNEPVHACATSLQAETGHPFVDSKAVGRSAATSNILRGRRLSVKPLLT